MWSDSWLFFRGADQRLSRLVHLLTHLVSPFSLLQPSSAFLGPLLALEQSFLVRRATRRCPGYCCHTVPRLCQVAAHLLGSIRTILEVAWVYLMLSRCEWQSILATHSMLVCIIYCTYSVITVEHWPWEGWAPFQSPGYEWTPQFFMTYTHWWKFSNYSDTGQLLWKK